VHARQAARLSDDVSIRAPKCPPVAGRILNNVPYRPQIHAVGRWIKKAEPGMKLYAQVLAVSLTVTAIGLLFSAGASRADAWQPLRDDPTIHQGLTVIAVGRHIHNVCPDINARLLRALTYAEGLVDHAQGLGFSRSEVNAYIDERAEQDRYRAIARAYFAQQGGDMDDPDSVCRVGRDEITAGSAIGRLLRGG